MPSSRKKPSSDLSGMYRAFASYLWVEDEETRTYLQTLWEGEQLFGYYVAGGHSHIATIVDSAHADLCTHVFGFRDRDFTNSNRSRWSDDDVRVFVGDVVEIENYLLDPDAIAACEVNSARRTKSDIEQKLEELAQPLVWWMSCRATISDLRDDVTDGFPDHPSRVKVQTLQEAMDAIVGKPWWSNVLPNLHPRWGSVTYVEETLRGHESRFRNMLADGSWRRGFSGKEILTDLLTWVWTKNRPADPEGRVGFVQAIAKAQRRNPPSELIELRTALRRRIGR